jgi:hypothetical protein
MTPTVPGYYIVSSNRPSAFAVQLEEDGCVNYLNDCDGEWLDWPVLAGPIEPPAPFEHQDPDRLGIYWIRYDDDTLDLCTIWFHPERKEVIQTCIDQNTDIAAWGPRVWPVETSP